MSLSTTRREVRDYTSCIHLSITNRAIGTWTCGDPPSTLPQPQNVGHNLLLFSAPLTFDKFRCLGFQPKLFKNLQWYRTVACTSFPVGDSLQRLVISTCSFLRLAVLTSFRCDVFLSLSRFYSTEAAPSIFDIENLREEPDKDLW